MFDLEDLGLQQLAGFGGRQRAWRVLGESGAVSRFEALRSGATPLVGRGTNRAKCGRRCGRQHPADLSARAARNALAAQLLCLWAQALVQQGSYDEALAKLSEGFERIDATGERVWEAELQRVRGLIRLAQNDLDEAQTSLQQAIRTAQTQ